MAPSGRNALKATQSQFLSAQRDAFDRTTFYLAAAKRLAPHASRGGVEVCCWVAHRLEALSRTPTPNGSSRLALIDGSKGREGVSPRGGQTTKMAGGGAPFAPSRLASPIAHGAKCCPSHLLVAASAPLVRNNVWVMLRPLSLSCAYLYAFS